MFCTKCGHELEEGAEFCSQCGTKVSNTVTITESLNSQQIVQKQKGNKLIPILLAIVGVLSVVLVVIVCVSLKKGSMEETVSADNDPVNEQVADAGVAEKDENRIESAAGNQTENDDVSNFFDNANDDLDSNISDIDEPNDNFGRIRDANCGDVVTLGSYEQDNNNENGTEPIEWIVLDKNGEKMLLLSRYILDNVQYNWKDEDVTWESCSLRYYLNGTFYHTVFSSEEQELIILTTNENSDNPYHGTYGGGPSDDYVFCLSLDEVGKYFYFNEGSIDYRAFSQDLLCEPTEYALNVNGGSLFTRYIDSEDYNTYLKETGYTNTCIGMTTANWWLRSPAVYSNYVCGVDVGGGVGANYLDFLVDGCAGLRPALWISVQE